MPEIHGRSTVDAEHPCLAGHFPGRPIVPAVLLLDLLAGALREQQPNWRVAGLRAAKFLQPVQAGQALEFRYDVDEAQQRANFWCSVAGQTVCQGDFVLKPA